MRLAVEKCSVGAILGWAYYGRDGVEKLMAALYIAWLSNEKIVVAVGWVVLGF